MLTQRVFGPGVWPDSPISNNDWRIELSPSELTEVRAIAKTLERNPLPTYCLRPDDYPLEALRICAERAKRIIQHGARFVLIDRIPVEEMDPDTAVKIYWLISSLIARPVAQKLDGTMLYHVQDKGKPPSAGSGVRPADTNYEQLPHTDNAFNTTAPEIVGLLCIKKAKTGGKSRCLSFLAAHNRLLSESPGSLERLYEPFPHDRQRENWPDEPPIVEHPIFTYDEGKLRTKFSPHQIRNAYGLLGQEIDMAGKESLEAIERVCNDPSLWVEFMMEPGQIQFVNNQEAGHARGAFTDHDLPEERRHMVRIWLRDAGRADYPGF